MEYLTTLRSIYIFVPNYKKSSKVASNLHNQFM